MNDIEIFKFEGNNVRTIYNNNQIWFCLKDVCDILGIKNVSDSVARLKKDNIGTTEVIDSIGRKRKMIFIDESNLYKLIFQSRKPEAERFTDWVTGEILPMIRQYGTYITKEKAEEILINPDTIIRLATDVKNGNEKIALLEEKFAEVQPKIVFADAVDTSENTILIRELAKLLKQNGHDIGEKRLFQWLRENKYLISGLYCPDYNMPTQKSMNLGLFEVKEYARRCSEGWVTDRTTKVTGKGQIYFINKFNKMKKTQLEIVIRSRCYINGICYTRNDIRSKKVGFINIFTRI